MSPQDFAAAFPTLYHAAWPQARDRIRRDGLMSPLALCEAMGLSQARTEEVMTTRRGVITDMGEGVVLNDNSPLQMGPLRRALPEHLSPEDWMRALNSRVFLFPDRRAVDRFTGALRARDLARDVWEVDGLELAEAHLDRLEVTPFNTGATTRKPPERDLDTFAKVEGLDLAEWKMRRVSRGVKRTPDTVREVCVFHSAPDVRPRLLT